jgi:glycerophosphoryl diester phosphodiesterase
MRQPAGGRDDVGKLPAEERRNLIQAAQAFLPTAFQSIQRGCAVGVLVAYFAATGLAAGRVLVEAHRGDSSRAPENTIASINSAVGIADLTEWDVQLTSDGAFVLMHDSTVDRTTNGTGSVSSHTLAGIKALDAGSWFSPAFNGERVPTMAEAINAAVLGGLTPLIERKAGGTAAAYHNEFVNLGLAPSAFRLIAFDWNFLDSLDAVDSNYNLGALGSGQITQASIDSIKAKGADFLDWEHSTVTQSVVDLVHANGMELHAWTVDSSARMQQLIDMGIDGITTNDPATLFQLVIQASRTADINMDNEVGAADWLAYNAGRGVDLTGLSLDEAYQMGDMNGDMDNDIADFVKFKTLYLQAQGTNSFETHLTVPEPTTVTMSILGVVLLLGTRRTALEIDCS